MFYNIGHCGWPQILHANIGLGLGRAYSEYKVYRKKWKKTQKVL